MLKASREVIEELDNIRDRLERLANKCEVEETPEDKVRKMFNDAYSEETSPSNNSYQIRFWEGRRMAIIDVLNTLGKKIEGVNA